MKRKILTFAVLATVAVGGAFASNAKKPTKVADTIAYEKPNCTEVVCGEYSGPSCSTLTLYSNTPGCTIQVFPSGRRQL